MFSSETHGGSWAEIHGETGELHRRFPIMGGIHTGTFPLPSWDGFVQITHTSFSDRVAGNVSDGWTGRPALRFTDRFQTVTPDGRWLVVQSPGSVGLNSHLKLLERASGAEVSLDVRGTEPGGLTRIAVRGRTAVLGVRRHLYIVDLATGKARGGWALPTGGPGWPNGGAVSSMKLFPDGRTLFTTMEDGTALTWDVSVWPVEQLSPTHMPADLTRWWTDLAGDAKPAYAAIWKLAESPSETLVPFLRDRLRPVVAPTAAEWKTLVTALNHPEFRVRAPAFRRLEQFGLGIMEDLPRELLKPLAPEVREQLEKLAAKQAGPIPPPETLRFLRALAVLEEVKTPAARRLVEELTRGVASARETKAATATLARMPDTESWRR